MDIEKKITDYVHSTTFDQIPEEPLKTVKNMVLDVAETTVAGAEEAGKP
jgi:2-methylcitrate dehydratase PrpD